MLWLSKERETYFWKLIWHKILASMRGPWNTSATNASTLRESMCSYTDSCMRHSSTMTSKMTKSCKVESKTLRRRSISLVRTSLSRVLTPSSWERRTCKWSNRSLSKEKRSTSKEKKLSSCNKSLTWFSRRYTRVIDQYDLTQLSQSSTPPCESYLFSSEVNAQPSL